MPGSVAGLPLALAGGLIVPCSSGAICWLGPEAAATAVTVFQLRMQVGSRLVGCSAAATSESGFVLSDGLGSLYLFELKTTPQPHLVEMGTAKLASPPQSPVAAQGQFAYLVDQAGELRSFSLPGLAAGKSWPLAGATFGPQRVADSLLVATGREELLCLDATQTERWRVPLADGPLAGCLAESAGSLVVAFQAGTLLRLAADSGKELARADLGQPLAGSPVSLGQHLLVPTADGCLLKVALTTGGATP